MSAPAATPVVAPSIDTIKRVVAGHFGVTETDMVSARRDKAAVIARHVAMLLARDLTAHSLPTIGRLFGDRDHSTVHYAVRGMTGRLSRDPALAGSVDTLRRLLRPPTPRFFVAWRHAGTGDRGHGATALPEERAQPLIEWLRREDTGNYVYVLVPAAEIETWKGQDHGQGRE